MSPVASKIMIIRHAEKPPKDGTAPFGVAEDGTPGPDGGKNMLVVRGWTRAGALAALFAPSLGPVAYPGLDKPQHLFACSDDGDESHRPHDTILPLSLKLGVPIEGFGQDDFAAMLAQAMGRTGTVLVCWEHKRIEKITALIPRHGDPPNKFTWPGDRFDVVFVFDLEGDSYRFQQVPELLLDGDSPSPIDVNG